MEGAQTEVARAVGKSYEDCINLDGRIAWQVILLGGTSRLTSPPKRRILRHMRDRDHAYGAE